MSLLTYIVDAQIRDAASTLIGECVTRPQLAKTDGVSLTYSVDVRILTEDAAGVTYTEDNDPVIDREATAILKNVPIAPGNRDLIYAEAGSAVTLARTPGGRFEVTGFSKRKPGRHELIPVDLSTGTPGTPVDATVTTHILTFGELGDERFGGGFGTVPMGAYALMKGDEVIEVRC